MYMRVTPGQFDASRTDEIQRWSEQTLIPTVRKLPGFRSYQGGFDSATGRLVAVSLWDTRAQAEGLRDQLGGDILTQIQKLGAQLEASQVYEVTTQS